MTLYMWGVFLIEIIFGDFRNYAEALISSEPPSKVPTAGLRTDGSDLPHQVLDSLFHIPKTVVHDPTTMNWRSIVKQMETFAQKRVQLGPSSFIAQVLSSQGISISS